jgi:invasion protein IalB
MGLRKQIEDYEMFHANAFAVARPWRRSVATSASALILALATSVAMAQQPAPGAPAQRPAPSKPAAQKPAAQKPAQPAQQPAQAAPQQQPQQQQAQGETPQLIFSPWTKFCPKGPDANAKTVCFTGRDAHTETGIPVVAAALIEPEGEAKKIFRVTLPSPVLLSYGSRIIIDQNQALTSPFLTCFANSCMADYEGTPDLVTKLKKGQTLMVQAINMNEQQISFPVALADFQKANEGAPTDPKVIEERNKKLQEDLQKKADELRKKMEQQGGQAAPSR